MYYKKISIYTYVKIFVSGLKIEISDIAKIKRKYS